MPKLFKSKSGAGFTLIELLVVIAIIGVLASIVLASLNTARRKSRDARRITDIKQIRLALELYYDGVGAGAYPTAVASCTAAVANGLEALSANNYIPQVPRDPIGANTVNCYAYSTASAAGSKTTYHLGATLADPGNSALGGDKDCNDYVAAPATVCATAAGATGGFSGVGNSAEGTACNNAAGIPYGTAGNTETCYDVAP